MLLQAVKFKLTGSAAKDGGSSTGFGASFLGDPARAEGAAGMVGPRNLGGRALFAILAVAAIVATALWVFERQVSQNQNPPIASVGGF